MPNLIVKTKSGKVFGPQPFLAIDTQGQRYIHDNFDFDTEDGTWFYAIHSDSLLIEDVKRLGVAANDAFGRTHVSSIDVS